MVANVVSLPDSTRAIQDMQRLFEAQRLAFAAHPYPTAGERTDSINRLKAALLKHMDTLIAAVNSDFGNRSADETKIAEIMTSLEGIKYHTKHLRDWMKPQKRKVGASQMPGKAYLVYQPLGVVGIIVPWNYPIYLAIGPMLAALAAGNRMMVKMSEFTPATALAFKAMCRDAFPEEQVGIVTGEADVAMAFSKLPFDHILFTGSTSVGKHVMRAAAENLTPVTLELGGKSPAIISAEVPMKDAVERIGFGKCFNAGQTCVSPDYVLLPKNRVEEFVTEFTAFVGRHYPTLAKNPDYTSIVNERQRKRLAGYVEEARSKGARVVEINPANESFEGSGKLPVTLVLGVKDDMKIAHDEIFGPLLIVETYDTLEGAVKYVNSRPRPLALYYFDYNSDRCDYVLRNTHSGGVCLNDTIMHVGVDDMPFGGIGPSGMGAYHGHEGFLTFSKAKGVFEKGKFNPTKYILPPYGRGIHNFIYKNLLK